MVVLVLNGKLFLNSKTFLWKNWKLLDLSRELNDTLDCIRWLSARRLLLNHYSCPTFNNLCGLTKRSKLTDEYQWFCKDCVSCKSIRHKSFWSKSHISLSKLVLLYYMWTYDFPMWIISRELDISENSLVDWFNFLRDLAEVCLTNNPIEIGGFDENCNSFIVEIDETACERHKFHKGGNIILIGSLVEWSDQPGSVLIYFKIPCEAWINAKDTKTEIAHRKGKQQ
jgi:hypothetical protein